MSMPTELVAIDSPIEGGYMRVPRGMKPIYAHKLNEKLIIYVEGWTAEKEYDQNTLDLYLLNNAKSFTLVTKLNREESRETWYSEFGEPIKEAMKDVLGSSS